DGSARRAEVGRARVVAVRKDNADVRITGAQTTVRAGFRVTFRLPRGAPPARAAMPKLPTPLQARSADPSEPVRPDPTLEAIRPAPEVPRPCLGHVFIVTVPEGASIAVDDERVERVSPTTVQRLVCGPRRIVATLGGYEMSAHDVMVVENSVV